MLQSGVSDNVGGVKPVSTTLLHALEQEYHFALEEEVPFQPRLASELKQDSKGTEQGILIKGIYVLRHFCITKGSNVLLVSEALLQ